MNPKDYFKKHQKSINKKIEYQQKIDDLSEETIEELIEEIKSNHCGNKESLRTTLYMIRKGSFARQKNIFLYLRVIESIIESIKFFFASDELAVIFRFISNKLIFLKLYNLGAIQFDSILKMIESFQSDISCIEPLIYFYPEIKKYNYPLYLKARLVISNGLTSSLRKNYISENDESIQNIIDYIIHMDLYNVEDETKTGNSNDNYNYISDDENVEKEFIQVREKGQNLDPISIAIKEDDIDKFQLLISRLNKSYNERVSYSIFEQSNVVNKRKSTARFIEYAAFFGSVKIFKFLLNMADLSEKVSKNAVKGGNYEIIHLCENYKIKFPPKCLKLAIRFHHNEIADYLIENYEFGFDIDTAISSIQYYNWEFMAKCIPAIFDPDPNVKCDNCTALSTATVNGYLDVVKILCSLKNININEETDGWNAIMFATFKGQVHVLNFFMSHFRSKDAPDKFARDEEEEDLDQPEEEEKNISKEDEDENESKKDENENENENKKDENENENKKDADENESKKDVDENENKKDVDENENNKDEDENENKKDVDENENNKDENENESKKDENEVSIKESEKNVISLTREWDGRTPLELAIITQNLNTVKYLLQFETVLKQAKSEKIYLLRISKEKHYSKIEKYLRDHLFDENEGQT